MHASSKRTPLHRVLYNEDPVEPGNFPQSANTKDSYSMYKEGNTVRHATTGRHNLVVLSDCVYTLHL